MLGLHIFSNTLIVAVFSITLVGAGDLSRYREFDLGSSLIEIARQTGADPEKATTLHERPALIQGLSWRAGFEDAVNEVQFNFYEGQLFRMMVYYDRYRTEGMTAQDLIDSTSAIYGEASRPAEEMSLSTLYGNDEVVEVIARWEDSEWSYNLVRFRGGQPFTLAVLSKSLDGPAQAALHRARELDREEAPQRAIERKTRDDAEAATKLDEARLLNRPHFQP